MPADGYEGDDRQFSEIDHGPVMLSIHFEAAHKDALQEAFRLGLFAMRSKLEHLNRLAEALNEGTAGEFGRLDGAVVLDVEDVILLRDRAEDQVQKVEAFSKNFIW